MNEEMEITKQTILQLARDKYPSMSDDDFGIKVGIISFIKTDPDGNKISSPIEISIWYNYKKIDLRKEIDELGDNIHIDPHISALVDRKLSLN